MREKGSVRWFDARKGYGFATIDGGDDYFIHYSAIEMDGYKTLSDGQEISFELSTTDKGVQAINVVPE
jgi:CspA family cold shock protein